MAVPHEDVSRFKSIDCSALEIAVEQERQFAI